MQIQVFPATQLVGHERRTAARRGSHRSRQAQGRPVIVALFGRAPRPDSAMTCDQDIGTARDAARQALPLGSKWLLGDADALMRGGPAVERSAR